MDMQNQTQFDMIILNSCTIQATWFHLNILFYYSQKICYFNNNYLKNLSQRRKERQKNRVLHFASLAALCVINKFVCSPVLR